MIQNGLQANLWALLETIARVVEPPERRKAREKAAATAADTAAEARTGSAEHPGEATETKEESFAHEPERCSGEGKGPTRETELETGPELDELAVNCLGAMSLMLRSEEAKEVLARPGHHPGLNCLLELATVTPDRYPQSFADVSI